MRYRPVKQGNIKGEDIRLFNIVHEQTNALHIIRKNILSVFNSEPK